MSLILLLPAVLLLPGPADAAPEPLANLQQTSFDRLQKAAGQVGIEVVAVPSGRVIYTHRSRETFLPASLIKLFTSYGALKLLGPDHRFATTLWVREKPRGSVIPGDLWIKGEGDPFLVDEQAALIVRQIRELGVQCIQGGVAVDNGYFQPQVEKICLDGNCHDSYNPVLSATALDFNTVVFNLQPGAKPGSPVQVQWFPPGDYVRLQNFATTSAGRSPVQVHIKPGGALQDGTERYQITGKLPAGIGGAQEYRVNVAAPGAFVARSFRALLQQHGIEVMGKTARSGAVPAGAIRLLTAQSPPLAEMIHGLNRYSNNFMAEMVLRGLGGHLPGPPGTAAKGLAAIGKGLREIGIPEEEIQLHTGSGLSRQCRASPRTFCRVLLKACEDPAIGRAFFESLAISGEEGTLKNRLQRTGAAIRGKTGTLSDVVAFAGYVTNLKGGLYAVTILLNQVNHLAEAREALDAFLEALVSSERLP